MTPKTYEDGINEAVAFAEQMAENCKAQATKTWDDGLLPTRMSARAFEAQAKVLRDLAGLLKAR